MQVNLQQVQRVPMPNIQKGLFYPEYDKKILEAMKFHLMLGYTVTKSYELAKIETNIKYYCLAGG